MDRQSKAHGAHLSEQLQAIDRARLTWRLLRDPRVAAWTKALVPVVAALYLLLPIDMIPDVILGLGQIDDVGVLGFAVFALTRILPKLAPATLVDEHLAAIQGRRGGRRRTGGDVVDAEFRVVDASSAYHSSSQQPRREYRV